MLAAVFINDEPIVSFILTTKAAGKLEPILPLTNELVRNFISIHGQSTSTNSSPFNLALVEEQFYPHLDCDYPYLDPTMPVSFVRINP